MSFKQDFDKIVEDLVGDISDIEEFPVPEPWKIKEDWYQEAKANYESKIDYEKIEKEYNLHQRVDNLYRKYEKRTPDNEFIEWFCEKKIHKCYQCNKSFIYYAWTDPRERARRFIETRLEMMPEARPYNTYHCIYCGMPFDIVNGKVLRIEQNPADIEEIRRQAKN